MVRERRGARLLRPVRVIAHLARLPDAIEDGEIDPVAFNRVHPAEAAFQAAHVELGRTLLPRADVMAKDFARLKTAQPLRLASMYGPHLAAIGATSVVCHGGGRDYKLPQAWSEEMFQHSALVDGIAYMSRHDDAELCFAHFDRSKSAIVTHGRRDLIGEDWFYEICNHYKVGLAP